MAAESLEDWAEERFSVPRCRQMQQIHMLTEGNRTFTVFKLFFNNQVCLKIWQIGFMQFINVADHLVTESYPRLSRGIKGWDVFNLTVTFLNYGLVLINDVKLLCCFFFVGAHHLTSPPSQADSLLAMFDPLICGDGNFLLNNARQPIRGLEKVIKRSANNSNGLSHSLAQ